MNKHLNRIAGVALACAPFLVSCSTPAPPEPDPDLIVYNGHIVTLDSDSSVVEAFAVREGRVLSTGTNEEILALVDDQTERIDLTGRTAVPGLADNHFHSAGGGPGVDLSQTRTIQEVLDAIARRADQTEDGEVIVTNSDWHEGQLTEQRLPYRDDLDRAVSDHPVVVVRGGHEYVLNSVALARWGIDQASIEPEGGAFGRYSDGRLNGELIDRAKDLVQLTAPQQPDYEARILATVEEHRKLNAAGLTSIRYGGASPDLYSVLVDMKERGLLNIRTSVLFRLRPSTDLSNLDQTLREWGIGPEQGDEWVRVGGVKLGVDGGFEAGWMREPYAEPFAQGGDFRGLQTFPTESYVALVRALNQRGWRVATHAVGDAAIDLVLEGYEVADADSPLAGKRWTIEHGFVPQPDQLPRMKQLGLHISAQNHLYVAAPSVRKYWGATRADSLTPVRSYLDAGLSVSLGTDAPVIPYSPITVLYHFITRDTISAGVVGPEQKLQPEEALRLSSIGNAELTFEEDIKGSLEAGKLADFVVLSEDILTVPENRIKDIDVVMTVVGGRVVYRND